MRVFRAAEAETKTREGYKACYPADVVFDEVVESIGIIVVTITRGGKTAPHLHRELTEIFIALTPLIMTVGGITLSLEPNDIVIAEPGEFHSFEALPDQDATMLAIKAPNLKEDKVSISDTSSCHQLSDSLQRSSG